MISQNFFPTYIEPRWNKLNQVVWRTIIPALDVIVGLGCLALAALPHPKQRKLYRLGIYQIKNFQIPFKSLIKTFNLSAQFDNFDFYPRGKVPLMYRVCLYTYIYEMGKDGELDARNQLCNQNFITQQPFKARFIALKLLIFTVVHRAFCGLFGVTSGLLSVLTLGSSRFLNEFAKKHLDAFQILPTLAAFSLFKAIYPSLTPIDLDLNPTLPWAIADYVNAHPGCDLTDAQLRDLIARAEHELIPNIVL